MLNNVSSFCLPNVSFLEDLYLVFKCSLLHRTKQLLSNERKWLFVGIRVNEGQDFLQRYIRMKAVFYFELHGKNIKLKCEKFILRDRVSSYKGTLLMLCFWYVSYSWNEIFLKKIKIKSVTHQAWTYSFTKLTHYFQVQMFCATNHSCD